MNDNIRYRAFLDEVKFLNECSKDYDMSIGDNIKAGMFGADVDKFLDSKRLVYNTTIVRLIEQYNIKIEDIYRDLDQCWSDLPDRSFSNMWSKIVSEKKREDGECLIDIKALGRVVAKIMVPSQLVVYLRNSVVETWSEYKKAVYRKIEAYIKDIQDGK